MDMMNQDILFDIAEGFMTFAALCGMGACGVLLLLRLIAILRGKECYTPLGERPGADMRQVVLAMLAALLSRILLYVAAYCMHRSSGGEGGFWQTLELLWSHWDTRHYVAIAEEWYTAVGDERLRLVFFPLFPLLMRLMSLLTGKLFAGGLLVSLLCSMGAAALILDIGCMEADARTGWLAVLYFLLNPMSVFLNCAYTEALFLLCMLGVVALLRRGHPWLAALCGMAASFTRMPGVLAAGFFLIVWLCSLPQRRDCAKRLPACLAQMGIVFAGLGLYWLINYCVTGDPLMYMTYQRENWYQAPGTFWQSAANTGYYAVQTFGDADWVFSWGVQLVCMLLIFAALPALQHRLRFDLAAYSFVYVAVVLAPTWLLSGPRYLYGLCALPFMQAALTRRNGMHALLLGISVLLLFVWTYAYTILGYVL